MRLSGIHIPTTTPFATDGEVDREAFRQNLGDWLEHGVAGFVVGGSTGEAVLLDESERAALWNTTRETVDDDRLLIAGTGAESTRATIRLCRLAAECGADAVLVQPPAFYRGAMSDAALTAHYTDVAEASPVPVVLYQVPPKLNTLVFGTEWVAGMAGHPNVIGIKDSRGSLEDLHDWVRVTDRQDFQVLVGSGALLLPALRAGAVGGILGVANLVPGDCVAMLDAFLAGRNEEAESLHARVEPLHDGIVGGMGVPGVKRALDLLGMRGGRPRSPLRPLPEAREAELVALLDGAGLRPSSG